MKKLTIGSAVYDDFEGVYFSYQSIRLNNQEILDDLDLLIIDNNPESSEGKSTKHFCQQANIRYIPYTEKCSTSVRNEIFKNAYGKFSMSIDCHVLFSPDSIKKLISFFEDNENSLDLFHGPMFYDQIVGHDPVVKMEPVWRDHMFGIWKCGKLKNEEPFEIPMHGLGIFACKTEGWLGFNEGFTGFGGEEGYIHEKFRQAGRKVWCLPFLKWIHRFQRPRGVSYKLDLKDRIKNYLLGWIELGKDTGEILDHFETIAPDVDSRGLLKEIDPSRVPLEGFAEPPSAWDVSSISFHQPVKFKYLRLQFYEDCRVNKTQLLPSEGMNPNINFASPQGITNVRNILSPANDQWCEVLASKGEKQIVLEYPAPMAAEVVNIYHTNRKICCSVSVDGQNWQVASVI